MYAQAIAIAVSAAVGAAGAWQYTSAIYQRQISDLKTEYAQAQVRAVEIAHADAIRLQDQASKAAAAAAARLQRLAADRDALRVATDGLRDDLATARARIPELPPVAVAEYATALSTVFGECAVEYEALAGKADGHRSDVQTLIESWPVKSKP